MNRRHRKPTPDFDRAVRICMQGLSVTLALACALALFALWVIKTH